jgi:hypothetical protein
MDGDAFIDFSLQFDRGFMEFRLEGRYAITAEREPDPIACLLFRFHHKNNLALVDIYE